MIMVLYVVMMIGTQMLDIYDCGIVSVNVLQAARFIDFILFTQYCGLESLVRFDLTGWRE